MLAGREGCGKSMLALALSAALGHGWREVVEMPSVYPGLVVYVDAENGPREAHRRLHGLDVNPHRLVYVEADGFSLKTHREELEALVEAHDLALLVLDSLRSLAPGLDENDSMQVEAVLRPITRLAQTRHIAILILHHASRASGEYRGSTAIGAAVELGFTLARHPEDPQANTRRRLTCWKSRPAAEPAPRWLTIEPAEGGGILLQKAEPFEPRSGARQRASDSLLAALDGQPRTWGQWAEEADLDPHNGTARRARDRLLDSGRVAKDKDGQWRILPQGGDDE
jgi:hypothetical protein